MERKTQTTINDLKPGDRFILASDKNKVVWTKSDKGSGDKKAWAHTDFNKMPNPFPLKTLVVFIRRPGPDVS